MNKLKNYILFLLAYLFLTSCSVSQHVLSLKNSSYTYVKSNLEFLASDLLEGRETSSRGEKIAALFISEELEKYGVMPFGDNGTYFQEFPVEVSGFNESTKISFIASNRVVDTYDNGENIVYNNQFLPSDIYKNKEYEIVFVGYGIFSEDDNYNSYENVDVNGKVVLLLNGTPKLNGEEILANSILKKYSITSSKTIIAFANGAVGVIVLPDTEKLRYWKYYQNRAKSISFNLKDGIDKTNASYNIPIVTLDEKSSKSLLTDELIDYNTLKEITEPNPKSFLLSKKIKFDYDVTLKNA